MTKNENGRFLRLVSEHYAILIGVVYLFAAIVGTTYYLFYFDYFGLRVFDYWTPSDVLLAAFRQPMSILAGIGAVTILLMMIYEEEYNAWLRSKGERWWKWLGSYYTRRLGIRIRGWFAVLFASFWFLVVVQSGAANAGRDVARGDTANVEVAIADRVVAGRFIATTDHYVMLLVDGIQEGAQEVLVIPVQSLQFIRRCAEQGDWLRRLKKGSVCEPEKISAPEAAAVNAQPPKA